MTEQIRYLTPGWRDEAERRLKSELCPERMNFITSSMSNIYLDCPDGKNKYLFFRFENGLFADLLRAWVPLAIAHQGKVRGDLGTHGQSAIGLE